VHFAGVIYIRASGCVGWMASSSETVREIEQRESVEETLNKRRVLNYEKKKNYPTEMIRRSRATECPLLVLGDSYKAGHFKMYQEAVKMVAYGEFREPMKLKDSKDPRIIVYGMRHIIDQLISRVITQADVDWAKAFYDTHGILGSKYEYPSDMFDDIRKLGHFPVKIEALPEGSVVLPHTPVFFITAEEKYSRFCTFLETVLTMVWYPSSVATLSKHTKCLIENAFEVSVPEGKSHFLLSSRLHDFGFRGCTCVEQSVLGGAAHLLNFDGSDTMSACFHVQYHLNNGKPVGQSIPATEHSVMTSFDEELGAMKNLIKQYPDQLVACVMDSYNYDNALEKLLPQLQPLMGKKGTFVIRPDSGDSVVQVLKALRAAVAAGFKATKNSKKYILLENVAVIQGDGINYGTVKDILDAVHAAGFSAQNVAFGMGGGLLQKLDRDTLSFATKLCYVKFSDGKERNVMKAPYGVNEKWSSPGIMKVVHNDSTHHTVIPDEEFGKITGFEMSDSMKTVYDNGKLDESYMTEDFVTIRKRVADEWEKCGKCFLNASDGTWGEPRHATLMAKRDITAAAMNKPEVATYTSNASLFVDEKYIAINREIKNRQDFLEAKKMQMGVEQSQTGLL
jgi:nicotinic acid phosphoribosyltransferase